VDLRDRLEARGREEKENDGKGKKGKRRKGWENLPPPEINFWLRPLEERPDIN